MAVWIAMWFVSFVAIGVITGALWRKIRDDNEAGLPPNERPSPSLFRRRDLAGALALAEHRRRYPDSVALRRWAVFTSCLIPVVGMGGPLALALLGS